MSQSFQATAFGYTPPVTPQWQPVQSFNFVAQSNRAYPINTTSRAITVTLPASPNINDQIIFVDYAGNYSVNNLTIALNGNKINGNSNNATISTNRASTVLTYIDAAQGWISNTVIVPTQPYSIEMFAWGGGGGGGGNSAQSTAYGGGGGAATGTLAVISGTAYAVVVGGGGSAQAAGAGAGSTVPGGGGLAGSTGYGGHGGGYSGIFTTSASQANALLIAGGGGGGAWDQSEGGGAGGGTTGAAGVNGGGGGTQSAGGTAVGAGQSGLALQGGQPTGGDNGGGGAGGGGYWGGGAGGGDVGHPGGGGSGYYNSTLVTSATLTQGSGSTPGDSSNTLRGSYGNGGAYYSTNGTQGVFIIRYLGNQRGTGGTVTSSGGYTYHTFTTAGTYTA